MQFVFSMLSDNLFPASHVFGHARSSFTFSFISEMLFEEKDKLVSSAYIFASECLIDSGRSLI